MALYIYTKFHITIYPSRSALKLSISESGRKLVNEWLQNAVISTFVAVV